jgi:uncharacterized protein (TIGR00369 family)
MHLVPENFERIELAHGFTDILGAVYRDFDRHQIGFRVLPEHGNPMGNLHGGALATFADLQLSALMDCSDGSPHRPTISLSIDYVASILVGSWVQAHVTLIRETRTLVFTHSMISVDAALVAQSSAIYRNRGLGDVAP